MTHVGPTYPTNGASADLHHWLLAIPKDPQKTRGHHAMTGKTGGKLPRYTVSIPYVPYLPSSSHGMLKYSPPTIIRLPFHGSVNPHLPFMDIYGLMTSPCFNHGTLKKKGPHWLHSEVLARVFVQMPLPKILRRAAEISWSMRCFSIQASCQTSNMHLPRKMPCKNPPASTGYRMWPRKAARNHWFLNIKKWDK